MYDIIGDIHGEFVQLNELLAKLGYRNGSKAISHKENRKVIFLGDFIDGGRGNIKVIETVRNMIEQKQAFAVMGNHEFNAICWFMKNPATGEYLRPHTESKYKQHKTFLDEVNFGRPEYDFNLHRKIIEWFKTLPLWLELDGLRAIHACWDQSAMDAVGYGGSGGLPASERLDQCNRLTDTFTVKASEKGTVQHGAVERLLKGVEAELPKGFTFSDINGILRKNFRVRWWDPAVITLREAAFLPFEQIKDWPQEPLNEEARVDYGTDRPLFIGHYKNPGRAESFTKHIACLDSYISNKQRVSAYRWNGEREIDEGNFVHPG